MFDTGRSRLGPRLSRRGQGFLNVVIGVLFIAPQFFPGEILSWWRLAVGMAMVLLGVYGVVTAGPSKNDPL
jgi:hypothetical protein